MGMIGAMVAQKYSPKEGMSASKDFNYSKGFNPSMSMMLAEKKKGMSASEDFNYSKGFNHSMNRMLAEKKIREAEEASKLKVPAPAAPVVTGEFQMETKSGKARNRRGKRSLYVSSRGGSGAGNSGNTGLNL